MEVTPSDTAALPVATAASNLPTAWERDRESPPVELACCPLHSSLLVLNLTESGHFLFLRMLYKGVSCHLACTVVYKKAGNDYLGHLCPVFINFVWFFFFFFIALRFSRACLAQASFGGGGWKVWALWRLQQLGFITGVREQNGNTYFLRGASTTSTKALCTVSEMYSWCWMLSSISVYSLP